MSDSSPQRLLIYGAGGFGSEVLGIVRAIEAGTPGSWNAVGFLVDPGFALVATHCGLPVFTDDRLLRRDPAIRVVIAVGSPAARRRIVQRLAWLDETRFASLVHPRAIVDEPRKLGVGSIVCAGGVVTANVSIARYVQIHATATVGHDSTVADFVSVYPGANIAGHATLREGAEIGSGSVVLPKLEIGCWSVVGAGTVVLRSVPANVTVVGNPHRQIQIRAEGWQGVE